MTLSLLNEARGAHRHSIHFSYELFFLLLMPDFCFLFRLVFNSSSFSFLLSPLFVDFSEINSHRNSDFFNKERQTWAKFHDSKNSIKANRNFIFRNFFLSRLFVRSSAERLFNAIKLIIKVVVCLFRLCFVFHSLYFSSKEISQPGEIVVSNSSAVDRNESEWVNTRLMAGAECLLCYKEISQLDGIQIS